MKERLGDIWTWHAEKRLVVITTNIGWKLDGSNPMGAGIARRAAEYFPELPVWYGARCQRYGAKTAVCYYEPANFILFPTKPLNLATPWLSWRSDSDLELIKCSAIQLQKLADILTERKILLGEIAVPLVGCENGRLERYQVVPVLHEYLDDRFVLVERSE